jgi:hypothetical protein
VVSVGSVIAPGRFEQPFAGSGAKQRRAGLDCETIPVVNITKERRSAQNMHKKTSMSKKHST